jgi:hypothetical protein
VPYALPVAAKIALQIAGAVGGMPGWPAKSISSRFLCFFARLG